MKNVVLVTKLTYFILLAQFLLCFESDLIEFQIQFSFSKFAKAPQNLDYM